MKIVVLFNLKEGVSPKEYEDWARQRDIPTVTGLQSVEFFSVHRATGLLGEDAARPPYDYIEIIDIATMDGFLADISTDAFQAAAAPFQQYADNPQFILTTDL